MRIHIFQHMTFEDEGNIHPWAETRGHLVSRTRLWANDPLPSRDKMDALIILGGVMNVYEYEKYPWLYKEKTHILDAIKAGVPVLGICLGAQLIADVLGARVRRNREPEIGWFPVSLTAEGRLNSLFAGVPDTFPAFHWHFDTFGLPEGAVRLVESAGCENQAFVYGARVVGLQFHLEYSASGIHEMLVNDYDERMQGTFVQTREEMKSGILQVEESRKHLFRFLDAWAGEGKAEG